MTQPTFPDGPPVPLLVEGVIDADTLRRLFLDLSVAARIISLREKGGPADYASANEPTLVEALQRLLSGASRATQVQYLFAEVEWTDTVLATAAGYRVVRCRHEPG
ncbi:hypothetical protein [Urbifossiella limnaea]|uniref:Uncharacterized protein n=1 Tax=Urbifossiella limnaea TaxID=2528023 RepID=A0A517XQN4_9BACT|nr:hypothetical protein [Urbifossiella limnaea]QDU19809.1 hypothetical protein ETAA1_17470 [Urbifossiella limnaea]